MDDHCWYFVNRQKIFYLNKNFCFGPFKKSFIFVNYPIDYAQQPSNDSEFLIALAQNNWFCSKNILHNYYLNDCIAHGKETHENVFQNKILSSCLNLTVNSCFSWNLSET